MPQLITDVFADLTVRSCPVFYKNLFIGNGRSHVSRYYVMHLMLSK